MFFKILYGFTIDLETSKSNSISSFYSAPLRIFFTEELDVTLELLYGMVLIFTVMMAQLTPGRTSLIVG